MADVTISYQNNVISEMSESGSKSIKTAGKYVEGDISIIYSKSNSGGISLTAQDEGKVVNNSQLVSQTARVSKIVQNGTYDTTYNNSIQVSVPGATILNGSSKPTAQDGNNGDLYLEYSELPTLPTGYTSLQYIGVENSGPYIDTGVENTSNAYYEIIAQYTAVPDNNYGLFGAQTSHEFTINYYEGDYFVIASNGRVVVPSGQTLQMHRFLVDGSGISVDDGALTGAVDWSKATGRNYYIFAINYTGGALKTANARIYSCKIWNNDTLVRNFIPCIRDNDEEIGMYDLVNSTFYTNDGTGSFITPSQTPISIINKAYVKISGTWENLLESDINSINFNNT